MIHNGKGVGAVADSVQVRQAIGAEIRRARLARRWSQAQLARALNEASGGWIIEAHYVSRWERGERKPGYEWAPVLERVLDLDLTALEDAARIDLGAADRSDGESEEDMRRRGLFSLAGGTILSSASGALESVRRQLDAILTGPITEHDIEEWEIAAGQYSLLVDWVPADRLISELLIDLDDARGQIEHVSDSLRPRLFRICALLSSVAATSLVTSGYWREATRYWRVAHRAARLSEDEEVSCLISGRRSVFSLYDPGGGPRVALKVADNSLGWSGGQASTGTASALAARAQGLALVGDRRAASGALVQLEREFDRLDDRYKIPGSAWNWAESRLNHVRSLVHSCLGNSREATAAQDVVLGSTPRPNGTGATQVRVHKTMLMIASGDPVQGVRYLTDTMEALDSNFRRGTPWSLAEVALQALPQKARQLPEVREVRELLHTGGPS